MLLRALIVLAFFIPFCCKKSPTPVSIDLGEDTILTACTPVSGGPETIVNVAVVIAQNSQEIRVFGLELSFDPLVFQTQKVSAGNLTGSWAAVDGNEVTPGTLRVGGFVGGGSPIPPHNQGALAFVQLKVAGSASPVNKTSLICINHYTDDIRSFRPAPSCATFTLKK